MTGPATTSRYCFDQPRFQAGTRFAVQIGKMNNANGTSAGENFRAGNRDMRRRERIRLDEVAVTDAEDARSRKGENDSLGQ